MVPAVYEYNDRISAEWFAPAGFTRGGMSTVLQPERKLSVDDRNLQLPDERGAIYDYSGIAHDNMILNLIQNGDTSLVNFAKKSMITGDIDNQIKETNNKLFKLITELDNVKQCCLSLRTPINIIEEFTELHKNRLTSVNKKRKDIDRQLQQINDNYKYVEQDKSIYQKVVAKENEICDCQNELDQLNKYIHSGVEVVLNLLKEDKFIETGEPKELKEPKEPKETLKLTLKGQIACHLREANCLIFSELLENNHLYDLSSKQLVGLFSCFTNVSVGDDYKENFPDTDNIKLNKLVEKVAAMYSDYQTRETQLGINSGMDYTIHYDLLRYTDEWCEAKTVEECKLLLQKIEEEKEIFLGEFVKALLKINNISSEMEQIAELTGNIAFLSKLKEIQSLTQKYVVTNQSLYV
jgi:superfamily II RNA helicase